MFSPLLSLWLFVTHLLSLSTREIKFKKRKKVYHITQSLLCFVSVNVEFAWTFSSSLPPTRSHSRSLALSPSITIHLLVYHRFSVYVVFLYSVFSFSTHSNADCESGTISVRKRGLQKSVSFSIWRFARDTLALPKRWCYSAWTLLFLILKRVCSKWFEHIHIHIHQEQCTLSYTLLLSGYSA